MQDEQQRLEALSKDELIKELLEAKSQLKNMAHDHKRRAERSEFHTGIEFIFDLDVAEARGVDISETGVAFEIVEPLAVELRFFQGGELHHFKANLVRTQKKDDGSFLLGLEFKGEVKMQPLPDAPDEDSPAIEF